MPEDVVVDEEHEEYEGDGVVDVVELDDDSESSFRLGIKVVSLLINALSSALPCRLLAVMDC